LTLKLSLPWALLLLVLVTECGGDESPFHGGMSKDEATSTVHARVERAHPLDTFPYEDEGAKTKTPRGVDAWLVKVDYESFSGDVCAYAWRDKRRKMHVQWDGGCLHWKYD